MHFPESRNQYQRFFKYLGFPCISRSPGCESRSASRQKSEGLSTNGLLNCCRTRVQAPSDPEEDAVDDQQQEHGAVSQWTPQISFDQPDKVDHACSSTEIDQSMQLLPALATQAANPAGGRCERQRKHQHEGCHSGGDEAALGEVVQHFVDIKKLVQPY